MAGEDKINEKANSWMKGENLEVAEGLVAAVPKQVKPERRMAAQILRLARRLGKSPDEIAENLPDDTIRRLKYPVLEQRGRDGTRSFEHDLGIKIDGRHSRP